MMASSIEFINGPFDGHCETVGLPRHDLPTRLVCYVSHNVFRLIAGQSRLSKSRVTSLASYQRQRRGDKCIYFFIESTSPTGTGTNSVTK